MVLNVGLVSDEPDNLSAVAQLGASQLAQISYAMAGSGWVGVGVWLGLGPEFKEQLKLRLEPINKLRLEPIKS